MSTDLARSPGQDSQPGRIVEVPPLPPDRLCLAVSRVMGTVVVTVHGPLNERGSETLQGILTDLIEGQGHQAVVVDMAEATVGPATSTVFMAAAFQAFHSGTRLIVKEPPPETIEALASSEWGDIIKIQPRTGLQ